MSIVKPVLITLLFISGSVSIGNAFNASVDTQQVVEQRNDSIEIQKTLSVKNKSQIQWLNRFENEMKAFREKDASVTDFRCDVLFVGSSSIRLWPELSQSMSPLKVVNRGYGGATLRDLFFNYNTVFSAYRPKAIVFYCDNDICGWKEGDLTVEEVFDLYRAFLNQVHENYPQIPIYFLSIKHSLSRKSLREKQHILNVLMEEFAGLTPYLTYVDVCTPLLDEKGNVRNELFQNDNLHLNKDGYARWVKVLKPILLEQCK